VAHTIDARLYRILTIVRGRRILTIVKGRRILTIVRRRRILTIVRRRRILTIVRGRRILTIIRGVVPSLFAWFFFGLSPCLPFSFNVFDIDLHISRQLVVTALIEKVETHHLADN
jgi:hypothetical protein